MRTGDTHALQNILFPINNRLIIYTSNYIKQPICAKVTFAYVYHRATDGPMLQASADYVRSMGIITFAVGVSSYIKTELRVSIYI